MAEAIDHPPHYNHGTIEAIAVIEDWKLDFCLGSAVKYFLPQVEKAILRE